MRSTASFATKPCPEFNFRHKFSLLVVGPTQSGETYFVQQILKHNRIVYEEQMSIRIFWYYNQWQECYEELKTSLGKSIRFERGVPELSENLCEINPRYNNIIISSNIGTVRPFFLRGSKGELRGSKGELRGSNGELRRSKGVLRGSKGELRGSKVHEGEQGRAHDVIIYA